MKFNDQKQFIVDRFTKELENAGLGAYRIEVVRDTNYCFRLASTCYINRRGYVRGYNEQPVMYFNVYEKVTDKCRHADMYKYMCYMFNSGTFVEYLSVALLLAPGGISHSGPGENRQFWPDENSQS